MQELPSKSQIDKLGKRLAKAEMPAEEDLSLLREYRAAHDPSLRSVVSTLAGAGLEAVPRLKTPTTIIDKLRREKTRLSAMQDVGGARVVIEGTLNQQDEVAESIHELFGGTIVDRRTAPTHGYRAVHLIATVGGLPIEIQIRTRLQNLWAQTMERVGDVVGRGVRYGEVPEDPVRRQAVEALIEIADDLAGHEVLLARVERWLSEAEVFDRSASSSPVELARVEEEMASLKDQLVSDELSFREILERVIVAFERRRPS